jgi:hypothetical protein
LHESLGSEARIDYGIELMAGLAAFPETAPLAVEFTPTQDALVAAFGTRVVLNTAVLRTRAELRIAEFLAEREIRTVSRMLEVFDGARRGPAHNHVLPQGVNPVVAHRRGDQAREMRALVNRLTGCPVRLDPAFVADWVPRFTAATERLEAAVAAYDAAVAAHAGAFAAEKNARAAHVQAIDRIMGQVRAAFPRDPGRQDAAFPPADSRSRSRDDGEADPVVAPAPATVIVTGPVPTPVIEPTPVS